MKKFLVLIVVVAVFVALFMPYVTGRVAEDATLQLAAQVNANSEETKNATVNVGLSEVGSCVTPSLLLLPIGMEF